LDKAFDTVIFVDSALVQAFLDGHGDCRTRVYSCLRYSPTDRREDIKKSWESGGVAKGKGLVSAEEGEENGERWERGEEKWLGDSSAFLAVMGGFVIANKKEAISKYENPEPVGLNG
jgi:hypothetical protein